MRKETGNRCSGTLNERDRKDRNGVLTDMSRIQIEVMWEVHWISSRGMNSGPADFCERGPSKEEGPLQVSYAKGSAHVCTPHMLQTSPSEISVPRSAKQRKNDLRSAYCITSQVQLDPVLRLRPQLWLLHGAQKGGSGHKVKLSF